MGFIISSNTDLICFFLLLFLGDGKEDFGILGFMDGSLGINERIY
jgi:hypothetical protein